MTLTTVDQFLAAGYRAEVVDRRPLTDTELADMVKLLSKADLSARLAALKGIPAGRCFVSNIDRGLLTRALAVSGRTIQRSD